MVLLSALPTELIQHIIDQILPEDLDNFAQISKRIRSVSALALENHRRLIRRYALLSNPSTGLKTLEPMLKVILANPRIGHYVKKIKIGRMFGGVFADSEGNEHWPETGDEDMSTGVDTVAEKLGVDRIHAAVDGCKLFDDVNKRWIHQDVDDVDDGGRRALFALLLSLLPNLTMLSFGNPGNLYLVSEMITRAETHKIKFLSHLRHVDRQQEEEDRPSSAMFETFLHLPSLRKLSSTGFIESEWSWIKPPISSNLTELELRDFDADLNALDHIVENCPHLQSFVLTQFRHPMFPPKPSCHPRNIIDRLRTQVPSALRRLIILDNTRAYDYMGPLCGLKALEHVHSYWDRLFPQLAPACRAPKGLDHDIEYDLEDLSSTLPKSLRTLNVRESGHDSRHRWKLIDKALRAKSGRDASLPHLEILIIETTLAEVAVARKVAGWHWSQRCDEMGLSLLFRTPEIAREFEVRA